ncbi:MAG: type II toxin-antitoxin system RelE/ParE family toxin [Acetobacteraceae bacterium]|nr:type II toxin-antitoxin system RelE/ParE family toxin [Acetobacteraceae bacterium]MBV8578368.1 type II toxin-antitoxin system RelE/ParE family toxin [Acetobacteraceae bacterium]
MPRHTGAIWKQNRWSYVQLYLYIAERSSAERAVAYLDRIEARCLSLGDFPERGTRCHDLWPGLRTMGFDRRVTLAFTVADDVVTILRVLYGRRDLESAFDAEG